MENTKYLVNFQFKQNNCQAYDLAKAASDHGFRLKDIPYSLRILFENMLRKNASKEQLTGFGEWLEKRKSSQEIDFMPARVLMQDFTGVPAIVDLAAMRDAMLKIGGNPLNINPLIPVDLVIDHSVQVDYASSPDAFKKNVQIEMERNKERYEFLKWGQKAFSNFRVVPPGTGICHQVNLEYLASVVYTAKRGDKTLLYPDSLVGTDSHTTMVNALSVLGWGVGGIEAEAAMLGQALPMILPEVVGVKLKGRLQGIITATDLVLAITNVLRKKKVVGKFVEYYGEGLDHLSISDRATIANMAPEYGATCGFFPVDSKTINYLKLTGRDEDHVELVEHYTKNYGMWVDHLYEPQYSEVVEINLDDLKTALAGPKRPQDLVVLENIAQNFLVELPSLAKGNNIDSNIKYPVQDENFTIGHGDLAIAAITSCTNTSNPSVMIGAGLLAKKAYQLGLSKKPWVKTSLAPGSQVVSEYYKSSGLDYYLEKLGFNLVGYGCTTCIGNSGPLDGKIEKTITENQLVVASVLSGNRNFEGRIHPLVRANYLASPPLVVAYAIAGTINIDLSKQPLGKSKEGKDIYLKDLWPSYREIDEVIADNVNSIIFKKKYSEVFSGNEEWNDLKIIEGNNYHWNKNSTYINNPPYFDHINLKEDTLKNIYGAKILALFGDSITTDHISPAGSISKTSPGGRYLEERGINPKEFNSYGARRGNHEVMMRGTFANNRIQNELCPGTEGGVTFNYLKNAQMSIYDAAMDYKSHNVPLVIFAGLEYGTGSSRDWAAKGTSLLGVKAVVARSFERIHRSNLAGMGVLPLTFTTGMSKEDLKLTGDEEISIEGLDKSTQPKQLLKCSIKRKDGYIETISLILQIFTQNEMDYLREGSIMHNVLKNINNEVI